MKEILKTNDTQQAILNIPKEAILLLQLAQLEVCGTDEPTVEAINNLQDTWMLFSELFHGNYSEEVISDMERRLGDYREKGIRVNETK